MDVVVFGNFFYPVGCQNTTSVSFSLNGYSLTASPAVYVRPAAGRNQYIACTSVTCDGGWLISGDVLYENGFPGYLKGQYNTLTWSGRTMTIVQIEVRFYYTTISQSQTLPVTAASG